jgi:hypothetical protein
MNSSSPRHVDNISNADKEKWLYQRGWRPVQRTPELKMWRHPETSTSYHFAAAVNLAKQDCRLPADFELTPDVNTARPSAD